MKKVKLKLSDSQMKALLLMINTVGINIELNELEDFALKEQYTKLFIKLQVRCLSLKPKNNSLKLSLTEAWAVDNLKFSVTEGYELCVIKAIVRDIEQQIVSF